MSINHRFGVYRNYTGKIDSANPIRGLNGLTVEAETRFAQFSKKSSAATWYEMVTFGHVWRSSPAVVKMGTLGTPKRKSISPGFWHSQLCRVLSCF